MKIKTLLKKCVEKKIIHLIDLHFSILVSKNHDSIIMLAAACVSYITRIGHVCLPLKKNKKLKNIINHALINKFWSFTDLEENIKLLKNSAIGQGLFPTPLVLSNNSLYLYRIWKSEQKIVAFFTQNHLKKSYNIKKISNVLKSIFYDTSDNYQKIAVLKPILLKNTFIIGGPGTGKTTTISKLILALIRLANNNSITIKLSAPTGKAASKLTDTLKKNIHKLNANNQEKKMFPTKTLTLHNLFKINPQNQKLKFYNKHFLNTDVLIIDEASMIDITMLDNIITGLSKNTKLILVGDFNQLPSVETGFILKDLCNNENYSCSHKMTKLLAKIININIPITNKNKRSIIADQTCILKNNYRFNISSEIHEVSQLILNKKTCQLKKLFNNDYRNINFFEINNERKYTKMICGIVSNYAKYWKFVYNNNSLKEIVDNFNNYRAICALNKGIFGVKIINKYIEIVMKDNNLIRKFEKNNKTEELIYYGKPIIITKNQKSLGLFNGDIGIFLYDKNKKLKVFFLLSNNVIKITSISLINNYKTAWSMTIHKSQGSEFKNVTIILPIDDSLILTNELIYTGITRSKKYISIYSSKKSFVKAIKTENFRFSNIPNLLKKY